VGRHRHLVNVRADGIAVVLGPLLRDPRIVAAALVDVDSGMVLDAWSAADPEAAPDLELVGAQHAEVVRCALALLGGWPDPNGPEAGTCEVVLGADGGRRHLLRMVPDPHGDRLALAVVVDGAPRVLDRVRKRLRSISVDALTAGPSMTRRPVRGGWSFAMPAPHMPVSPERPESGPSDGDGEPADVDGHGRVDAVGSGRVDGAHPPDAVAHRTFPVDGVPVALPVPRAGHGLPERSAPAPDRPLAAPQGGRGRGPAKAPPRPPSPPAALPAPAPARPPRS
jgi:hypothetical protein